MNSLEYLRQADQSFDRTTRHDIYEMYIQYVNTGKYPYLDAVVQYMVDLKPGFPEELRKQLHHEVYLASDQYHVEKMVKQEQELTAQGFTPITEIELSEGKKIMLYGHDKPLRIVKDARGEWFGFPPRHTRSGVNISMRLFEHSAYERAKIDKRTHMQGEKVNMVKEI